jgi:ectoine hydroxylase-related dioxygenase (phytanoyl-CoA dioxygenase family)
MRIHLDDCGADNGALRVVPGSHVKGRIPESEIPHLVESMATICCTAFAGDGIIMSPLLLHASSKATKPSRRRVIHIEFSAAELPSGLEWAEGDPPPTGTARSRAW